MEITRLRVSGFKSFSEPVELQLESGLTGIVGPNGCGKSNIVEALRWAMGESSAKGLRGDGMEDVIFNGSATRPAHDVAEVRLKLRGRAEGLAGFAEEGDLEVARRIGRGTGSTYRINGREARARDVQMLFADAAAGARSPAIISQGQIGFIVDAKPADRRKLLEDAAGIGGLQARRREAELRLEATRANLQRVLDLLAGQETRLAELAKQGRQAQRYRQLAAELRTTEAHLLLARHADASRRATATNEQVAEIAAELARHEAAAAECRRLRADAVARLPGLRETATTMQVEATGLRERLASLREAAGREAAHLTALARQRDEAAQDLLRTEKLLAELGTAIRAGESEVNDIACEREGASEALSRLGEADEWAAAALATAQEVMRGTVARAAEAAAQHETAREQLVQLRRRSGAAQAELAALPTIDSYRDQAQRAANAAAELAHKLTGSRARLTELTAVLADLEPTREACRTTALTAEREASACRARLAECELRLRELRTAAARWRERAAVQERGLARAAERQVAHGRRSQTFAATAADADMAPREAALAAAEQELAAADGTLDAAREALSAAEQQRADAAAALRVHRRSADALEAEIGVLESLVPADAPGGLLDRLEVPEELTMAVAAALGDDLLAGTEPDKDRYWQQPAEELQPPRLPIGAKALLELVAAPALLAARLARIGLVDAGEASALSQQLQPGHRLVSRDGGLWRWDGFVRAPGGEDPAAARIRHRLRLQTAREELAAVGLELAGGEVRSAACELAVEAARAALGRAEIRWRAADAAQLRARQRVDEGQSLAQRRGAELSALDDEAAALALELAELERERLELATSGVPEAELAVATAEETAARVALEAAQARFAGAQTETDRAESAFVAAQRDARVSEEAVQRTAAELDEARLVAEVAARAAADQEAERRARAGALERELAELADALAIAEPTLTSAAGLAQERAAEHRAAETALSAAETVRRQATEALLAARSEAAALARRLESSERGLTETNGRRVETETMLGELRQRLQRLEGEKALAQESRRSDPEGLTRLDAELARVAAAAEAARAELDRREAAAERLEGEVAAADAEVANLRERLAVAHSERGHAHEGLAATVAAVRDRLQQEPLSMLADEATRAAVASANIEELEARLARLRASRDRLGPVNLRAEVEAAELSATVSETRAREAELEQATDRLRAGIGTLDGEARQRLLAAFEAVDGHFRRLFSVLFGGGKAHLRLAGAEDPLQAGLELEASPPGKKLSSISLLSGGEKTMTALALVFAFFLAQPSPLCVLDEVDAPLDDANVDRFVALMQEIAQTTGTRFLVVTHHPLTMAHMDRLYGVTMAERGISRLVSVALERALELRATA